MKRQRRLLSAVLAFLLVLSYLPVSGIALDLTGGERGGSLYAIDPSSLNVKKLGGIAGGDGDGSAEPLHAYNDTVRVSIFLDEKSTADAGYSLQSLSKGSGAAAYRESLKAKQNDVIKAAGQKLGHSLNVKWKLTLLANAISAEVKYYEIAKLSLIPGVRSVEIENRYDPQEAGVNTAGSSAQMVFAQSAWEAGYSGAGTRIAVIDTGIDTAHQSFDPNAFLESIGDLGKTSELMTASDVSALSGSLNGSGTYLNAKMPYVYNYVDGNTTVDHLGDTQGEHGSHVAGIAAANKYIKQGNEYVLAATADTVHAVGMAPDAQLIVMKVFGASGGAYDSDYMVAIEDAIVLGCDACNLSLGSASQGYTYDTEYQTILNKLSDGEDNFGMVVSVSAGNSGAFADYLDGEGIYLDDVVTHTGGSPGTFVNSLCTASADNVLSTADTYITVSGTNYICYEDAEGPVPLIKDFCSSQEVQFVYIDALGNASDYSTVNRVASLRGKLVIVNRGDITFAEKGSNAASYSPLALLVANNTSGVFGMNIDGTSATFPMAAITLDAAESIKTAGTRNTAGSGSNAVVYYTGTLTLNGGSVSIQQQTGTRPNALVSDFSSWGVPGSLLMKPEITAPGGDIWSVLGAHKTKNGTVGQNAGGLNFQYESMSGTSMAAPHIAGLAAIVAQYIKENNISIEGYSRRAVIQSLLMSTATPMKTGDDFISILQQGAGLADVNAAVSASSVIFMTDDGGWNLTTETGAADDGKVKVELGDDPYRIGRYSYSFRIYNISGKLLEFNAPDTSVFTQGYFTENGEYYMDRATVSAGSQTGCLWVPYGEGVENPYDVNMNGITDADDAQAVLDYLTGLLDAAYVDLDAADADGDGAVTSHDSYVILIYAEKNPVGYYIPADGYADVTVTFSFDVDEDIYTAGAYIEGFTTVAEKADQEGVVGVTHTIPILGFWGSFTDPEMFDTKSYTEYLYGSEQVNYSGNEATNYITLTYDGAVSVFTGNPYVVEDVFPSDRLAVRSDSQFKNIYYNLVRAAGTTGFAVSLLDEDGLISDIVTASVNSANVDGMWYDQKNLTWKNTQQKNFPVGYSAADFGLEEGDRFRIGFYALPEYYGLIFRILTGSSLTDGTSGVLSSAAFRALLTVDGFIGSGAYVGYDFYVDDTAPQILSASLEGNYISVNAEDDRNLAYIAVLSLDGSVIYAEAVPGDGEFSDSFDIASAVAEADGYVAVFAADYAGNEAAVALRVNDATSSSDPYAVSSIEIMPESLNLYKGNETDLTAKVSPLTATDRTVSWSSDNEAVATVDEFGHLTAVGAGSCVITATSNSNTDVSAGCQVTVTAIDKTLNGIIWDVDATTCFASFNASDTQNWTVLARRDDGDVIPLNTAFMNGGTLYAATLDVESEEMETVLYTVDRNSYELTELGTCYLPATDIAIAPTGYSDYMVYSYGPYLIFGNLEPEEDDEAGTFSGFPYGYMDVSEYSSMGDAYIAAVAVKSVSRSSAVYYLLDDYGKIWQTTMTVRQGINFSEPSLVVDTGIATTYIWQDLYFDGTYIYWGHTGEETGDYAKLIIIDPAAGIVYDAGDFGERVWPVGGFYVDGHDAPYSAGGTAEETSIGDLRPVATRNELNTEKIRARLAAETASARAVRTARVSSGREASGADEKTVDTFGTGLTRGAGDRSETETAEIVYTQEVDVTNGLVTVGYDPEKMTFIGIDPGTTDGIYSCNEPEEGTLIAAFAFRSAVGSGSAICTFIFTEPCAGSTVTVSTLEKNSTFEITGESSENEIEGIGHNYIPEVVEEATYTHDGLTVYTCEHCGDTYEVVVAQLKAATYTVSLSLEDSIDINFYLKNIDADAVLEDFEVVYTFRGISTTAAVTDRSSNRYTVASCAAKEVGDTVNIKVFYQGEQIKEVDYSVRQYCETVLAKEATTAAQEKQHAVCLAVLDYGAGAQQYFGYNTDNLANSEYTAGDLADVEIPAEMNLFQSDGDCSGISRMTVSLALESKTELNFYFTPAEGVSPEDIAVTLNGEAVTEGITVSGSGVCCLTVKGISGRALADPQTISVSYDGTVKTAVYSPLSWAYANQSRDDATAYLSKALYNYYLASSALFG